VNRSDTAYGEIFACGEALLAESEADLVIFLALGVVEVPDGPRFSPQQTDPVFLVRMEAADAAGSLMSPPFPDIQPTLFVERDKEIVAFLAITFGVPLLAREK
jgi:hypothetical protein